MVMLYVKATCKNCKKDFTAPKLFQTRITYAGIGVCTPRKLPQENSCLCCYPQSTPGKYMLVTLCRITEELTALKYTSPSL